MSRIDQKPAGGSKEDDEDVRLMRLMSAGDTQAFEELIERHQSLVAGTVARMLGSNSEVEDIAQQVFIRVWKSAGRYTPRAKFTTWLLKITRNLVFNLVDRGREFGLAPQPALPRQDGSHQQGRNRDDQCQLDQREACLLSPDASRLENELQEAIEKAITELPERQRMALVLRRYEELNYEQIAEILDLSVPAVKSILFRARTELRAQLSKYLNT